MVVFFIISFITNIIGPVITEFIRLFDLSLLLASFLPLSFFFAYGIFSIPAGLNMEKYGGKRMIIFGFLISLFGSMSSFFILEFLTSIKNEEPEFIVHSLQRYKTIFKGCSEALLYLDCILFLIPINILIYNVLNDTYGLVFNIMSGVLFILGLIFSYCIIIAKQEFKDNEIKRRIYKKIKYI